MTKLLTQHRRSSRAEKARIWRWACWGGVFFGVLGFTAGVSACLYYKLPIPPLFTTELGVMLGGSLGAFAAYLLPPGLPDDDDPQHEGRW